MEDPSFPRPKKAPQRCILIKSLSIVFVLHMWYCASEICRQGQAISRKFYCKYFEASDGGRSRKQSDLWTKEEIGFFMSKMDPVTALSSLVCRTPAKRKSCVSFANVLFVELNTCQPPSLFKEKRLHTGRRLNTVVEIRNESQKVIYSLPENDFHSGFKDGRNTGTGSLLGNVEI